MDKHIFVWIFCINGVLKMKKYILLMFLPILLIACSNPGSVPSQKGASEQTKTYSGTGTILLISKERDQVYISSHTKDPIPDLITDGNLPDEYKAGDIVAVEYAEKEVQTEDKKVKEYHLIKIEHGKETGTGITLAQYINFTPVRITLYYHDYEKDTDETKVIEEASEIQSIQSILESITVYPDGTPVHGAGYFPFKVEITGETDTVVITEMDAVTVSINGQETELYYHGEDMLLEKHMKEYLQNN